MATNAVAGAINLNSNEGGGNFHGSLRGEGGGLGMARGGRMSQADSSKTSLSTVAGQPTLT